MILKWNIAAFTICKGFFGAIVFEIWPELRGLVWKTVWVFHILRPSVCLAQIDQVKQDLSRKDTELLGLQTKLETLTNQFSDSKQHIDVLKESLTAKEQRAAILQTEVRVTLWQWIGIVWLDKKKKNYVCALYIF